MKRFQTLLGAGAILACASGCTQFKQWMQQETVQSQRNINWLKADPKANTSAETAEDPPILPQTYYAAGRLFEQQNDFASAIVQYQKAVAVNHNFVAAYARLGVCLSRVGRHADAEAALRKAIELAPGRAFLHNNLGYAYALQSRWSDAERELREAIRIAPDYARAHVNLGLTLAQQQRFEESLNAFDRVLPQADAYYNLGLMFRGQHRYRDAADAFQRVLAMNPGFTAAQKQLDDLQPKLQLSSELEPVANVPAWNSQPTASEQKPPAVTVESKPIGAQPHADASVADQVAAPPVQTEATPTAAGGYDEP